MAELVYVDGSYDMVPLGRGKGMLSVAATTTSNGRTITTGFKRITGLSYGIIDGAVDADTQVLSFGVNTGTITVYSGDIHDYTFASGIAHFIIVGHLH